MRCGGWWRVDDQGIVRRRAKFSRDERLSAEIADYVRKVGRKAQKGKESNDRRHDRSLEQHLSRMPLEEIDRFMRDDDSD